MAQKLSPKELLAELEAFTQTTPPAEVDKDPILRSRILQAARQVVLALETPVDVVSRLYLAYPVETASVRIAGKLGLFRILKESDSPKTLKELTAMTGANETLLARVLRSLAAFGAVKEVGDDGYAFVPSYELLADQAFADGLEDCSPVLNPSYNALPEFLASTNYENPTDITNTAIQRAFNAKGKSIVEILTERPKAGRGFGILMSVWGENNSLIQDIYPVRERLAEGFDNQSPEAVMWVDVGGGYGQKTIALKKAIPDLPGRFIVQDLPSTVANAPAKVVKDEGIEIMGHDFFTEQPVKGARAYYIRQCLHNWADEACVTILRRLREAMKPGYSKLFVHELIMPQRQAGTWMATQDFNMMALLASEERTEAQWRGLLSRAGLKVVGVYCPEDKQLEGLVEAEVA